MFRIKRVYFITLYTFKTRSEIQGQAWRKILQLFYECNGSIYFKSMKSLTYMLFVNSNTQYSLNQKQTDGISSTY